MSSSATAQLFSNAAQAAAYSAHRPTYPSALYTAILNACRGRDLAVDIATGSGQAATALAGHFGRVVAQDGSESQLAHANREHANVEYQHADALHTGLADSTADLVTVAQALHWFHGRPFYDEVRRILKPGGCFAAWTYGIPVLIAPDHPAQAVLLDFHHNVLGDYWAEGRRHVEARYAGIEPVAGRDFASVRRVEIPEDPRRQSLDAFVGYLSSWSAYATHLQRHPGQDPMPAVRQRLMAALGAADGSVELTVTHPLTLVLATDPPAAARQRRMTVVRHTC